MLREHEIEIRVRYQETDGQGRLHHANYLHLLRAGPHRAVARRRIYLSPDRRTRAGCWSFRRSPASTIQPANYDDLLRLRTIVGRSPRGPRGQSTTRSFAATRCWPRGTASWPASIARAESPACRHACTCRACPKRIERAGGQAVWTSQRFAAWKSTQAWLRLAPDSFGFAQDYGGNYDPFRPPCRDPLPNCCDANPASPP